MYRALLIVLFAFVCGVAKADDNNVVVGADTLRYTYTPITERVEPPKCGFARFMSHYGYSEPIGVRERGFDYSFTLVPYYSKATNLGLGVSAVGYYGIGDVVPSTLSVGGAATLSGAYRVALDGQNSFQGGRHRIDYNLSLYALPTDFWGVGYSSGYGAAFQSCKSSSESVRFAYRYSPVRRLALSVAVGFEHIEYNLVEPLLNSVSALPLTLGAEYDSRDLKASPTKGVCLAFEGTVRPKGCGDMADTAMGLKASAVGYCKLWQGAVLAGELLCELNSASTPWLLYPQAGDSSRMRGYYTGRFRDRNMVFAQAELRQSLWRGLGFALWGGAGNWFGTEAFSWSHTLPTYGVSLRFAASKSVTLRLDYGLGKRVAEGRVNGFVFAVSEAF